MIGAMPFASALDLRILDAVGGTATVALPLSPSVSWSGDSFQAAFVALVADLASGAAAASVIGDDEFPLTVDINVTLLAPTRGDRLVADANVLARVGSVLLMATTVRVERDGSSIVCGAGTVKLRSVKP